MPDPILTYRYPNGLILVAEPMPWLQSAAFTFLTPGGCAHDPDHLGGLSGFLCEMAMRGAGPRDSHEFILALDNLGVEHSESISPAHASYSGATLAENLPAALELFADLLREPHLPADELEACRGVMFQEFQAIEDEPSEKTMLALRRRHYPDPWGRPPQGDPDALAAVTIDDLRDQFQRCYRPEGTILGVAGSFQWRPLRDLVGRLLGGWAPQQPAEPLVERAGSDGPAHIAYDSLQTHIGVAYSSVPYRDPDYFHAWGAVGVLSGGMSSRLFTEVRERRGLCYTVYAAYHTLRDRAGVFCYAGTTAERAQETLDVMLAELRRLASGIDPAELDRLKARIKSASIMQQESSSARSGSIARDWYHLDHALTLDELGARIDALTPEGINAYLQSHPPADFTVVALGCRPLEVPGGIS